MLEQKYPTYPSDGKMLQSILEIFFKIDEKIMDLHQCSSDDFLSLNRVLKENHQKARQITQDAGNAFDRIGEQGNITHLGQLSDNITQLKGLISGFEEEINQSLNTLELLEANFSLMFVPINNFRQNLTSLKLLLSNIKLTNTLKDRSLKSFSDEEAIRIDGVIGKVKDSCPVFEENIYNIQKHVKSIYQELSGLKTTVFAELYHRVDLLQADLANMKRLSGEALKNRAKVDDIARNCNKNVGSIITNLQYHDIIRQKMEHIQQTHKLIISELNGQKKEGDKGHAAFFLQIPQITEIQVAQLLHTNKEYQEAIDIISTKMIDIGSDMVSIARICKCLGNADSGIAEGAWEKIEHTFRAFVKDCELSLKKYNTISDDISLVQKIIAELFDRFQDLEMMENAIEQRIIDKISFGNLLVSEEAETASQAQQILKLYAANHFEKNKLRTLFESSSVQLRQYRQSNTNYVYEQKGLEKIFALLDDALALFDKIDDNARFIESVRFNILETSHEIEKAGKEVVSQVNYYAFFEKTIDEVIAHFERINSLVELSGNKPAQSIDNASSLELIEKYYTMKSQRIIHNETLRIGRDFLEEKIKSGEVSSNREGNDVEFF